MNDKERARLMEYMKEYTIKNTTTPELARATLIAEGIYNEDLTLTKEYGGDYTLPKNNVDTGKVS